MLAVTTFSPDGYQKYAKRCLESLISYFPGKVIAYVEEPVSVEGVEVRDFFSIPVFDAWLARVKRHPGSDGLGPEGYDFRYDAQKFCRKVFAQDAVFDEDSYVFWIDADSFAKKPIPEDFLESIFGSTALAFMGRVNSYSETGFVGFSTKHPEFKRFRDEYLPWIKGGRIFSQLKGWHDCIAFDHARQGIPANNLTPKGRNYDAVMEQSVLHPYLTHLKGNRKYEETGPKVRWA